jgi:uncharacterized membrane protein
MRTLSDLSPIVLIHLFAALSATSLGPAALLMRWRTQRPKLHRAFGYAWVTMMLATALSALFIRSEVNLHGFFSWIHLLIPVTILSLIAAFWFLAKGNIRQHRNFMISLYVSACLIAGGLTLMPNRFLGQYLWG